jgi:hypothetical protein
LSGTASVSGGELTGDSDADEGGNLLRLIEICVRRIDKRFSGEADDSLVTLHASPWVYRHGEMAISQQRL